jgi:hypothetical protein
MNALPKPASPPPSEYEADYFAWCNRQAELLRLGLVDALDRQNLIEEIEDMGRNVRDALWSSYFVLLVHLLKWRHQAARRSRSWRSSINRERVNIERRLKHNPSLRPARADMLLEAYAKARRQAAVETGLPLESFPAECSFSIEEIENENWLPQGC